MGGDQAPREVIRGAVLAARRAPSTRLLLVGIEDVVRSELEAAGWDGENIKVVPARNVIQMSDAPLGALRRKRGSSIEEGVRLVRQGEASALVSAGNTGACVAAATILLGLLPLVKRAGIAVTFHAGSRPTVIIDVGANISSRPEQLIQYGIMASLYARKILGVEAPRVGLLNIGEEDEKGNTLVKETRTLFRKTGLNFVGNVEGVEIFSGTIDVVVCDGFTGNVVLKVSEGLAERLVGVFEDALGEAVGEVGASSRRSDGALRDEGGQGDGTDLHIAGAGSNSVSDSGTIDSVRKVLNRSLNQLREKLDFSEYGGAPLLGVDGVVIIAHGRSDAKAISNAISVARRMTEADLNLHIAEEIEAFSGQKVS